MFGASLILSGNRSLDVQSVILITKRDALLCQDFVIGARSKVRVGGSDKIRIRV